MSVTNKFCLKFIRIFLFFTVLIPLNRSDAWEMGPDFIFSSYETRHFWDKNGKKRNSLNHFRKVELDLYLQLDTFAYGIVSTDGSFAAIYDRLNGNTYGFGDIEVNWTFQPFSQRLTNLWLNVSAIIPMGPEKDSLRYGQVGFEFDIFYSDAKMIYQTPFWYYFGLGYRAYNGFPSDQIRGILNTAVAISSKFYLYGIANLEWGLFNGKRKEHYNQLVFNPNYRLARIEIGAIGYLTDWMYIDAGYFYHLCGANIGTGGGFIGGIGFCF